jgi:phage regulator Rha-like protein
MKIKLIPQEVIQNKIFLIRGLKVMLDKDLAELYEVDTKHLTRQVRRNIDRFPEDFLLTLTRQEVTNSKRQFGTSSWGGKRKPPFAFTEHGILMLSSVLNSKRAVQVNIQIMRAFNKLREMLAGHKELREKIDAMEKKYDHQFQIVFRAIKELLEPVPAKPKPPIGFHV